MAEKVYVAIDLKSFYASCECVALHLDPLTTNLVVADLSRTEKTICLAVTPSLKAYGVSGRARLFEVVQRVKEVNAERLGKAPGRRFTGKSSHAPALAADPSLELDYIVAKPRMRHYMAVSTGIFNIYMKYVSPEDIHVYSIDEVFIDATNYLKTYNTTPREFAMMLIKDVLTVTGITATAGIGPNLYLCKVAMDIMAKHMPADSDGVRIAELDVMTFREKLWDHRPITDILADVLPATLELSITALIFSTLTGSILGLITALHRGSIGDNILSVAGIIGLSIPQFFFGMICILIFGLNLKWLPVGGRVQPWMTRYVDHLPYLVMPVLVLGISMTAGVMRYSRAAMLDTMNKDYIKTARSKGLPEWRVNLVHGFRVSLTPVVVLVGFRLPTLISGSGVIESIFQWPGIGLTFKNAVTAQNYPVVMIIALLMVLMVLFASLLIDILTRVLDPRVKL